MDYSGRVGVDKIKNLIYEPVVQTQTKINMNFLYMQHIALFSELFYVENS